MKKIIRFLLLLVAASLIWAVFTIGVSAAPNYKKLYGRYLKKGKITVLKGSSNRTIKLKHFLLLDIDRDGTKELLTYDVSSYDVDVFTIKKGKVKYAGWYFNKYSSNDVTYNKKRKGLVVPSGGGGYFGYYMTGLKNGKLYDKCSVLYENFGKRRYLLNGKPVSKKKAERYDKKYFSKKDYKLYIFYDNTSKNRNKHLK